MEDTLLSIDSKYRDFTKYPNESNFTFTLEKIYKNIVSVKLVSLELTNTINYISTAKKNNYFTIYLPNTLNDPVGIQIAITDSNSQNIDDIKTQINNLILPQITDLFISTINSQSERYFYIFYLNSSCLITFDFNLYLTTSLILSIGWYSIYGIVLLIQNYVQTNYNTRQSYLISNPSTTPINLDSGKFIINEFTLNIFDRRQTLNIRSDIIPTITTTSTLSNNLITLKNIIYNVFITDTTYYIPNASNTAILDKLMDDYGSVYYINSSNITPNTNNLYIYNITMNYDNTHLKTTFYNDLTTFYYTINTWPSSSLISTISTTLIADIPQFQIDFNTSGSTSSSFTNNMINNNSLTYPSIGYFLGYRILNNIFILSPTLSGTKLILTGTKYYNTSGEDYIFLIINDWGNFDFFNQIIFSKIYLRSDLSNSYKTNNFINKEYVFRQLTNVSKLNIQLIDYLGNIVDLNGTDFSFTISLRTQANVSQKQLFQNKNL